MKTIIRIFIVVLFISNSVSAQDFQGIATYKTQRKMDIKLDSTKVNSAMQEQIMAMMKKQFQKTFTLTFNKEASIYKEDETLAPPQGPSAGGITVIVEGLGGSDILYKNTKDNRYTDQKDTMGKLFLVKDDIEKVNWTLEKDTKHIGEYQCFKATFTKMVESRRIISGNVKAQDENLENQEPEMEERTVTAWYTPQIPVNNGPSMYHGLPGLILEVHDGDLNIICSKIVLNPKNKVDLKEPTKGKEVNQKKYDDIMEKKEKEMMERFKPKRGDRNNGNTIQIEIGG